MSYADEVRDHCDRRYIQPARARGQETVRIRAGDVHGELGYKNRLPLICSALGSKLFEEMSRVDRIEVLGPLNGSNTVFVFAIRR